MIDQALATAFLWICEQEGNSTTIENIANAALAQFTAGYSSMLSASTINGKSFTFIKDKAPSEVFMAASYAIKQFNSGIITAVETDFRFI